MTDAPRLEPADELAIRSLIAVYSDAVICRDGAAAASVFADDGVLHAFAGDPIDGRDAIERALSNRVGDFKGFSYQIMSTVHVTADGDGAVARSHYFEISSTGESAVGRLSTGTARDRFVRTAEGWRVAYRRLTRSYVGDMAAPGKSFPLAFAAWAAGADEI
ncbi:MAG: nuclear transport factor 2 family protein [Acidimicrobiia bacterium]